MKVCVYLPYKGFDASGVGSAVGHHKKALEAASISYTTDPSENYDVLHTHFYDLKTLSAVRRARKQGKKIVLHAHTSAEDFRDSFVGSNMLAPLLRVWLRYFYKQGDLIIAPTPYTQKLLRSKYGITRTKVISNGVAAHIHNEKAAKSFKEHYGFRSPIVFGVGIVFLRKGILDFIAVSKRVPATFCWVGRDLGWLLKGRRKIMRRAAEAERFRYLGYVKDINGLYDAGDIFFFPSYEENEAIVVLEAAAAGKAILVRDIPCFRSYLTHGKNCLMAKSNEEFATYLRKLLADEKLRKRLGKEAQKIAKERSFTATGRLYAAAYKSI